MRNLKPLLPAIFGAILLLCGCQSFRMQDYVSPRITGVVLDAETGDPVPNVTVRKVSGDQSLQPESPPKGGEQMLSGDQVQTDKDGRFAMAARKDVLTFSSGSAFAVRLQFQHSRYESFRTNYSGKGITVAGPKRPPELNTGEILLRRLAP